MEESNVEEKYEENNETSYQLLPFDSTLIDFNEIQFESQLGSGNFGVVYK